MRLPAQENYHGKLYFLCVDRIPRPFVGCNLLRGVDILVLVGTPVVQEKIPLPYINAQKFMTLVCLRHVHIVSISKVDGRQKRIGVGKDQIQNVIRLLIFISDADKLNRI